MRLLAGNSLAVVVALGVLGFAPPARFSEAPIVSAQTRDSRPALRLWRCLTIAASTLGTSTVDSPCDLSMPRPSSLHLAPTRAAARASSMRPPDAPIALTASVSAHRVTLTWSPSAASDAPESFMLEAGRGRGRTDLFNTDVGADASTLILLDVPAGSYFLRVRSRATGGVSAASNEVLAVVGGADCASVPGAPSGLSASSSGATVTLTWQAPTGGCAPTAYTIEAGSSSGLSNLTSFSTGNTTTSFTAAGVGNGTYFVRVRATNASGASAASNEFRLVVGASACQGLPGVPQNVLAGSNGTLVRLYWDEQAEYSPLSYIIEAGTAPGLSNVTVFDTGNTSTSLTATAAVGTYYIRLRIRNACGTSPYTSAETVLVVGATPSENVTITMADIGAERFIRMTDLAGSNWETGPTVSPRPLVTPWHMAIDARGRLYVAEKDMGDIVRMDDIAGHGWKTFSGVGSNTIVGAQGPYAISVNLDAVGRIYISSGCRIMRIDDMDGTGLTTFGQCGPSTNLVGSFNNGKVVIFDLQGRFLVGDTDYNRIVRFDDFQGTGWTTYGLQGSGVGGFNRLEGLAVDSLGRIYIADHDNHRIERINDMTGAGWIAYGSFGSGVGQFNEPHDIAVSPSGKIYVDDTTNSRLVRLDDMSGTGWTAFGRHTRQPTGVGPCPGLPGCLPSGVFEFIAPKGLRVLAR